MLLCMERSFSREHSDDNRRQAYKANRLVDEGLISADQASQMPEEEFDRTVQGLFDSRFTQDYNRPAVMGRREGGHDVEDIVVQELQHLGLFEVEHGSAELDQGRNKADIILHVAGFAKPVYIQLTLATGERAQRKFAKLPETTIPVIAERFPSNEEIQRHPERLMRVIKSILEQILAGLRRIPEYQPAFNLLWDRYAQAQAA